MRNLDTLYHWLRDISAQHGSEEQHRCGMFWPSHWQSKSFVTSLFAMLSAGRSLIVLHMDIRAKEVDVVVEVASQMREPTGNRILQAHMRPAWGPQSLRTTHPVFMFQHGARAAL